MKTVLSSEGQITIPRSLLEATGLEPGAELTVDLNDAGEIVVRKEAMGGKDRFDEVLGTADVKWRTDELMTLLRGDD
jgi:antitoxin PrlF